MKLGNGRAVLCSTCDGRMVAMAGYRVGELSKKLIEPKLLFYLCPNGHATEALPLPSTVRV